MDLIPDTSVIIEIFGGDKQVLDYLSRYNDKVFGLTAITEFELFSVELKEREVIMLDSLPTQEFNKTAGRIGGHIFRDLKRAGKMPRIKDLLIASTCIANHERLLTTDRDFEVFKDYGLDIEFI
jgi:predicted nucleic acid-binding protein